MSDTPQESLVAAQFGPRAAAYVASAVHAQGPDLADLAALAAGRRFERALDLGCGGGHCAMTLAPSVGTVIAYDLSEEMLAAVRHAAAARGIANLSTRQGVVERLPFETGAFDLVVSRYSAHHWTDWEAGLAEARRVLRPGGAAVFMDAVSPGPALLDTFMQAIELMRDPSHVRDYSRAEWEAALTRAGFAVGAVTERRLRLEFSSWIQRMATPPELVAAIRSLQAKMSADVVRHFAFEPDGGFTIDTATIMAA